MNLAMLKNRALHLFGLSVVSQMVLSLTSFVAGVLLIRYTSDHDYGYYVLAQSGVLLALTVCGAWVSGPLSVLAPKRAEPRRRAMLGRVEMDARRMLILIAPVGLAITLGAGGFHLVGVEEFWIMMAAGLAMMMVMYREVLKTTLLIESDMKAVFRSDMAYAVGLLLMVGLACTHHVPAGPTAVLGFALGATLAAAIAYHAVTRQHGGWVRTPDPESLGKTPWEEMRPLAIWSTLGATIYWLFGQGYNSVLAIKLDAAAVAAVAAVRLLMMPTYVLTMGVQSLMLPTAARWLHEHGLGLVVRRLLLAIAVLMVMNLCYFAVLWLWRDWITDHVLKKTIPQRDTMILLWLTISVLFLVRDLLQNALLALGAFRPLAVLSAVGATAALGTMWIAIDHVGMIGALYGLIVGEAVNLVGLVGMLWLAFARQARPRPASG